MSFHAYDPGDRNNWYQSPQLGLFPTSLTGYSGGYYCLPSSHPHVTQFPSHPSYRPLPSQFPFQSSYSPPPPPSHTIINGFVFPYQFPSTHTHHSPDSKPDPWLYPSISQSRSYDPSVTSVNSHFVSTKTMPTSPVYHSAPSIPTFQSPSVATFVPQHQFTDLKPLPLHSKPIRGCRCRVVMGATARVSKKTRNPDLLRDVGKYSRSKRYHRRGLWVIKAKNGDIFPHHNAKATVAIMEELHQLLVGQKTPITEPASSPLKFGSLPAGSVALTAANGSSSMLSASSRGIQISEKPNLNLSPHEVILGLNKNFATALITGIHSEHTTTAVVPEELVLNVDKNIARGVHGVKFSDIADGEDDNEDKDDEGGNECVIFGSSAASKKFLKELQQESNTGSYSGAASYGDHSLSYNDDSQRVDGKIVTVEGNDDLMRDDKYDEDREREQTVECNQVDRMSVHVSSSNGEHEATGVVGDIPLDVPAVVVNLAGINESANNVDPNASTGSQMVTEINVGVQISEDVLMPEYVLPSEVSVNTMKEEFSKEQLALVYQFYGVLCDVIKFYSHSSLNCKDGEENWSFDDKENDVKQPDFSEVDRNALGAGQIFAQGAKLVDSALESGKIYQEQGSKYINEVFKTGTLHFIGLLCDGGVHSRLDQVQLLLKGVAEHGAKRICLHVLTDGRDVLDGSSVKFAGTLDEDLAQLREKGVDAQIASGGGRMYVTMDCYENDWSVVKRGWDAQVLGEAPSKFKNAVEAIKTLRAESNANDQYLPPFVIVDESGRLVGPIVDGDAVVTFNFRADRMVMAAKAFEYTDFDKFNRVRVLKIRYVGSIKPLINQSSDSLVKETKSPGTLALTLVVVENKKGVNDVTKALVALMNESKQEVPNWLNDYAEQSLSYGGDQSQVYGSSNFGGYNFCGNDNYSYCDTSYNGGESNAPGTAGSLSFGNYCFSVSGAIYFPNFMITFIEFGFVAIDVGALALIPQIHFSLHMWSKEALLLILLSAIMRSNTMVGKVMNMNLETMVGKVRCGREKELHVNLFKIHREPLEKCVGYTLSTLNASCLRVQKFFLVDWAFANVPISWKDVETKLFALNMVTKVLLQEGNPTGRSDQFKFKAFVLMITSEGKLPCKCLFGLPFSRMVFLICRLIDWKRCQGYHVVLRIAALKIYLFVVLTVWSRLLWLCLRCLSYLKLEDKF